MPIAFVGIVAVLWFTAGFLVLYNEAEIDQWLAERSLASRTRWNFLLVIVTAPVWIAMVAYGAGLGLGHRLRRS